MLMLIDTRDQPPEPGRDREGRWLAAVLSWLFPWPAVIAWLYVGGIVLDELAGAVFAVSAIVLTFWRLAKAYPHDGLGGHTQ